MNKRWVGAVIYDDSTPGVIKVILQESQSMDPVYKNQGSKIKYPGGTSFPGETDEDVLRRELFEELWVELKEDAEIKPIFGPVPGKRFPRHFYLINWNCFCGDLRTVPTMDDSDELKAPFWVTLEVLERHPNLVSETHFSVLPVILHYFERKALVL